jgi:hypothetical protein
MSARCVSGTAVSTLKQLLILLGDVLSAILKPDDVR